MGVLVTCKNEKYQIKKMKALEWPQPSFHYNPKKIPVTMETRVLIRSGPEPNAAFLPP